MFVIAGLGNPGPQYARNRHNFGFMVVRAFAEAFRAEPWRTKFQGETARCRVADTDVLLVCPTTFMNRSGETVQAAMNFFRVSLSDLLVVHDELDLPFGTLRLKPGGGHAGHNGLRSIMQHLGEPGFMRMRCGIGRPQLGFVGDGADYVLSDFRTEEREALPSIITKASDALSLVLHRGFGEASKVLNTRPKPPKSPKSPPPSDQPSEPGIDQRNNPTQSNSRLQHRSTV